MAERLTFEGNFCEIARCKETRWGKYCPAGACSQRKVWEKLKEYEDAADVAPVRHGRWIDAYPDIEANPMFMYGICSECGFEQGISKYLNYCPNCGAKMDGAE